MMFHTRLRFPRRRKGVILGGGCSLWGGVMMSDGMMVEEECLALSFSSVLYRTMRSPL